MPLVWCLFQVVNIKIPLLNSAGSGISQTGGGQSKRGLLTYHLAKFFPETAWKWKKLDRERAPGTRIPGSANDYLSGVWKEILKCKKIPQLVYLTSSIRYNKHPINSPSFCRFDCKLSDLQVLYCSWPAVHSSSFYLPLMLSCWSTIVHCTAFLQKKM